MVLGDARPVNILLIEDNEGDVLLTLEAFKEAKINNSISVVIDGEVALDFLHQRGEYLDVTLPDLIFLDINLPKKNGKQVLADIKSSAQLSHIPVVIMTSSKAEQDVVKSYELNANAYVVKPISRDKLMDVVSTTHHLSFSMMVSEERVAK